MAQAVQFIEDALQSEEYEALRVKNEIDSLETRLQSNRDYLRSKEELIESFRYAIAKLKEDNGA